MEALVALSLPVGVFAAVGLRVSLGREQRVAWVFFWLLSVVAVFWFAFAVVELVGVLLA